MEGYEKFKMIDWGWVLIYQQKMGIDLFRSYRDDAKSDMDFKRKRISTGKLGKDDSCSNSEISEKNRECGNMLCSSKALEPYSESQKEPP